MAEIKPNTKFSTLPCIFQGLMKKIVKKDDKLPNLIKRNEISKNKSTSNLTHMNSTLSPTNTRSK